MQWTNIWTPKKALAGLVILLQTIPLIRTYTLDMHFIDHQH